jgi:hypothetical protein
MGGLVRTGQGKKTNRICLMPTMPYPELFLAYLHVYPARLNEFYLLV